jgi:type VI secretion system secreted protein VgrG
MAASFLKVFIDGKELTGEFSEDAILGEVEVRQELNHHWWCSVECRQTEDRRFPIEDSLGKKLKVQAVDEAGTSHTLFDGFVLEGELEYEIFGSFTARLTGVTKSYKMDVTPRQAYYPAKGLDDVANEMGGRVGLSVDLSFKPITPPLSYVQWGQTDFAFLQRLADDHKCWIRPTDKGLEIFDKFQDGSTVGWRGEEGLREFDLTGRLGQPSMNGAHYYAPEMTSEVYKEVKEAPEFFDGAGPMANAVKKASADNLPPGYVYQRSRANNLKQYETLLKKESVRAIGGKILGHGVSRNEDLLPGNTVQIDGVLDAAGLYGLVKVIHRWTKNGYMNEFWCTPWQNYTNREAPRVREWHGIVPARVVANDDPSNMGRVKVKFFWQEDSETFWVRTMTPHAGADRGFFFMPEVGDEVVVAFGDGDPERPCVIGSIWNGVDSAPTEEFWGGEYKDDDVKRIVTKSGHRIQIVDKPGKESIAIATPNFLKITLIEKTDETGRSAITVCSENGDILLSAPNGRIHFRSKYFSREVG